MKIEFTVLLTLICLNAFAQKDYLASNGVTYHIGDTVKIGVGSSVDGWFKYILPSALNTSDTQRDWFKENLPIQRLLLNQSRVRLRTV